MHTVSGSRIGIGALRVILSLALGYALLLGGASSAQTPPAVPLPLVAEGHPVQWWFAFKFNSADFPSTTTGPCPFGGEAQTYKSGFSQNYVYASSDAEALQSGSGAIGTSVNDPLGATFSEAYNGDFFYVVWNDQFYGAPAIAGCSQSCSSPWGHSKGMVVWNAAGDGFVLQVSTPSWPASGSAKNPRQGDGNTLGCVDDNDVLVSQHFFSLMLSHTDLVAVLKALANASVVTDPKNPQLVRSGGPADVQALVQTLGVKSANTTATKTVLSSGVILISKPSALHVPPWQMVSSLLASDSDATGVPLRAATWWANPTVPSTTATTPIPCWDASLPKPPGPVDIATTGVWAKTTLGLRGGLGRDYNHAKFGVSTSEGIHNYVVFGDMNQQGALSGNCGSSQNGRGGLFFVVDDATLHDSVAALIAGSSAPTGP